MSRMLEEIRQQPEALARTLSAELKRVQKLKRLVEKQRPRLVVLVARGTSDNAALFGRYLLEITTGIPVSLAAPSIATLYEAKVDYRDALVVAISQSGESTDTNLVLERARQQGALTLGITNESGSTLAKLAEHVSWCAPAAKRAWPPPRPTPGRCSPCTCWPTRSAGATCASPTSNAFPKSSTPRWRWSRRSTPSASATVSCATPWSSAAD